MHLHSSCALAVRGETNIKYAEVVSGYDGVDMMVILGGRCMESITSMILFRNAARFYAIRKFLDDIYRIWYRSGLKGFMNRALFAEWPIESRIFKHVQKVVHVYYL